MAGNNTNKKGICIPRVDETPVPCPDGYMSTDCIYCTDGLEAGYFGVSQKSQLTELVNAMVCHIKEQDREIEYLKKQIKIIKDNGNNW